MPYLAAPGGSFGLLSDLVKQAGVNGIVVKVVDATIKGDAGGGDYTFDSTSTSTPDGLKVLAVTGLSTGRWIRSMNGNYNTGRNTFTGALLQTAYVVTHNLGYTPTSVQTEAESQLAAVSRWVSNRTSTSFTINFAFLGTVPVLANGLTVTWVAFK